jgi:hypothetical protein
MFENKEQDKLDQEHLNRPQVGDYWHEMCAPICVVVSTFPDKVLICETTKIVDQAGRWTWNLEKLNKLTLEEFKRKLCYKSEGMKHQPMSMVVPRSHSWVRKAAIEDLFGGESL